MASAITLQMPSIFVNIAISCNVTINAWGFLPSGAIAMREVTRHREALGSFCSALVPSSRVLPPVLRSYFAAVTRRSMKSISAEVRIRIALCNVIAGVAINGAVAFPGRAGVRDRVSPLVVPSPVPQGLQLLGPQRAVVAAWCTSSAFPPFSPECDRLRVLL